MDRFGSIWGDLQTANRFPWNGQLMSTCEAELQELMKQIDIMVQNKKLEWERDIQGLEAKLEMRDKEVMMQRATVEQKHREIGQLRQQVDGMERAQREMVTEYEHQMSQCRTELINLKKDYEKLQRKHSKHSKESQKEKNKTSTELQDSLSENQRLQAKLEEYRHSGKDWELEKRTLEKQIESLESQRRTYAEKCDLIQQQAVGFQSQLDKRRQILDNTEYNLKTQIAQLEGQLERAKDTMQAQESQIEKLKTSLDDTVTVQRRVLDEKDFVEKELRDSKKTIMNLEDEVARLKVEFQKHEDILKMADDDQHQRIQEINKLEQTIMQRDEIIQSFEMHGKREHSEYISQLQDEIRQLKTEVKAYKKNEKKLNDENNKLQNKLLQAQDGVGQLEEKFQAKAQQMALIDGEQIDLLNNEIAKLKDKLSMTEENHGSEVAGLRQELSNQTTELHKRNVAMAGLTEKVTLCERQLREESEKFERRAAELQVANAQLEALRLENRHLRQTALKQIHSNADVMEAEAHLKELQNAYTLSVSKLEQENRDLHQQMVGLQDELHMLQQKHTARAEADRSGDGQRDIDERRYKELQREHDRKIKSLREQLEKTARQYESEIQGLQNEKKQMQTDIESREESFKRMMGENSAMSSFVTDVEGIITSPNKAHNRSEMVTPRLRQSADLTLGDGSVLTSTSAGHYDKNKSGRVHFDPEEKHYRFNGSPGIDQNAAGYDGTRPKGLAKRSHDPGSDQYADPLSLSPFDDTEKTVSAKRSDTTPKHGVQQTHSPFHEVDSGRRAEGHMKRGDPMSNQDAIGGNSADSKRSKRASKRGQSRQSPYEEMEVGGSQKRDMSGQGSSGHTSQFSPFDDIESPVDTRPKSSSRQHVSGMSFSPIGHEEAGRTIKPSSRQARRSPFENDSLLEPRKSDTLVANAGQRSRHSPFETVDNSVEQRKSVPSVEHGGKGHPSVFEDSIEPRKSGMATPHRSNSRQSPYGGVGRSGQSGTPVQHSGRKSGKDMGQGQFDQSSGQRSHQGLLEESAVEPRRTDSSGRYSKPHSRSEKGSDSRRSPFEDEEDSMDRLTPDPSRIQSGRDLGSRVNSEPRSKSSSDGGSRRSPVEDEERKSDSPRSRSRGHDSRSEDNLALHPSSYDDLERMPGLKKSRSLGEKIGSKSHGSRSEDNLASHPSSYRDMERTPGLQKSRSSGEKIGSKSRQSPFSDSRQSSDTCKKAESGSRPFDSLDSNQTLDPMNSDSDSRTHSPFSHVESSISVRKSSSSLKSCQSSHRGLDNLESRKTDSTLNLEGKRSLYSPFDSEDNSEYKDPSIYGGRSSSPIMLEKSPSNKAPSVHFDESPLKQCSQAPSGDAGYSHDPRDSRPERSEGNVSRKSPLSELGEEARSPMMRGAYGAEQTFSLSDQSDAERPGSRASVSTRFLQDEQERAKDLEKLIDSHIEELKQETEKTLRKYHR